MRATGLRRGGFVKTESLLRQVDQKSEFTIRGLRCSTKRILILPTVVWVKRLGARETSIANFRNSMQ